MEWVLEGLLVRGGGGRGIEDMGDRWMGKGGGVENSVDGIRYY